MRVCPFRVIECLGPSNRCPFSPLFWLGGFKPATKDYRRKLVPTFNLSILEDLDVDFFLAGETI